MLSSNIYLYSVIRVSTGSNRTCLYFQYIYTVVLFVFIYNLASSYPIAIIFGTYYTRQRFGNAYVYIHLV